MNKEMLKVRYGHICDTDILVDKMMATMTKYHHPNTEHGVCSMLDTFFIRKANMISMLQKSKHYIGDLRAVVDIQLERTTDVDTLRVFCRSFRQNVDADSIILKRVNDDGDTLEQVMAKTPKRVKAKDLLYGTTRTSLMVDAAKRDEFFSNGVTKKSAEEADNFSECILGFRNNISPKLGRVAVNRAADAGITLTEGMKTSRGFNRVCAHYGVDRAPMYNKLFAEYSNMVSGLKRNMKFFISVNPLDYLTMSFGNSWASCHTIDQTNMRNMPNAYRGEYCGGTVSYMLDSTSFITYVHSSLTTDHEDGKVYRCMFHYNNGTLIQGRIYPQGNDGATDLYKTFRGIVQAEISEILGMESDTWVKKAGGCGNNTETNGVHYPDYTCNGNCNVSYMKAIPNADSNIVQIGHARVCPLCGEIMDITLEEYDDDYVSASRLVCYDCE